jgi:pseudouridine kinase
MSDKEAGGQYSALVVGAMNMDVLAVAAQSAIPGDSTPGKASFCAGGVARNIAEALARFSVSTQLHSIVGNDAGGEQLLAQCRAVGIDCDRVQVADEPTSSYIAIHDSNGSLLHAINAMSITERFELESTWQQDSQGADICVIDANLNQAVIDAIGKAKTSCLLAADAVSVAKCRRLLPLLPRLALLKVNRAEAVALTGADGSDAVLLQGLLSLGCRQVLMTLGEAGSIMATSEQTVHAEAQPVSGIRTVNGAGDSMFAAVITALLCGQPLEHQLSWGTRAAALSLQTTAACSTSLCLEAIRQ